MSAFMHDPQHFAAIVGTVYGRPTARPDLGPDLCRAVDPVTMGHPTYYRLRATEWADLLDGQIACQILARENARSVAYRYSDDGEPDIPEFAPRMLDAWERAPLSVVEALMALDSLEYQSCECPDWQDSAAWRLCQRMRHHLIRRLPGYDTAGTWAISEPPDEARRAVGLRRILGVE